jgi:HK97 family phage major capsid protein
MGMENWNELLKDVREVGANISQRDAATMQRVEAVERSLNQLHLRVSRPGPEGGNDRDDFGRRHAVDLLETRHSLHVTKHDPVAQPFVPNEAQIAEATTYRKAFTALLHTTDAATLAPEFRKSLSSFTFESIGHISPPELSNRILSCLIQPDDVTGMFDSTTISGPSIRWLTDADNIDLGAAWACQTGCFANSPQQDLSSLFGEIEIKPEPLRFTLCMTNELAEDASFPIENHVVQKVAQAYRTEISRATILGTGAGLPLGLLSPRGGVPICDAAVSSPAGQFTLQDLIALALEVPVKYWNQDCSFIMNQHTFGLLLSMSDSVGRPLVLPNATDPFGFTLFGFPVRIVNWFPDVAPGSTPVAFGNWRAAYMVVWRRAMTMLIDPYSGGGFCRLLRFEVRVGGAPICPNAVRLMRIR